LTYLVLIVSFLRKALRLGVSQSVSQSLDRRLGGPQSWLGRGGEDKKIPAPAKNRTPVLKLIVYVLLFHLRSIYFTQHFLCSQTSWICE